MDSQHGLIWFLTNQFLMNVGGSSTLVSALEPSLGGDQGLEISMHIK